MKYYLFSISLILSILFIGCSTATIDKNYNAEKLDAYLKLMLDEKEITNLEGAQLTLYLAQRKLEGDATLTEKTYKKLLEEAKASASGDAVDQIAFQVEKMAEYATEQLLNDEVQAKIADGILQAQQEAVRVSQELLNNAPEIPTEVKDNLGKFVSWANIAREQGIPTEETAKGLTQGIVNGLGGLFRALGQSIGTATQQMNFPSFKEFSTQIETDGLGNISKENIERYMEGFARQAFQELGNNMSEMGEIFTDATFEEIQKNWEASGEILEEKMREMGEEIGKEIQENIQ